MEQFPVASALPKIYSLEGHKGQWEQVKYTEARLNPSAVRAIKGNTVSWFIPIVEDVENVDDLTVL